MGGGGCTRFRNKISQGGIRLKSDVNSTLTESIQKQSRAFVTLTDMFFEVHRHKGGSAFVVCLPLDEKLD